MQLLEIDILFFQYIPLGCGNWCAGATSGVTEADLLGGCGIVSGFLSKLSGVEGIAFVLLSITLAWNTSRAIVSLDILKLICLSRC